MYSLGEETYKVIPLSGERSCEFVERAIVQHLKGIETKVELRSEVEHTYKILLFTYRLIES